ncbi:MAG: PQQ-binding-like beta-propeller repeat protein [Phycisphaerae bacterium]|nr:PQQ-binding-like beta-propeller repeat protein [Phycisphaerae bacterium]NIR68204.1 PQQ-binding-like beta-propeller repeat protein [candidate division Zixibacteria bacterium]NIW50469.1 PQQ-binding-like beta-propeller repeat protein [Gammaproteobacteria bacterium]NIP55915.1 PQQ-binding-like beta-propeller repeat protein [Phycisphaerae bacterium]NIS54481.1 PQQ-binding-like beta-propeller repeat protein [Phycisphaerae bacterium]
MSTHKIIQLLCIVLAPAAFTTAVPISEQQSASKILSHTGINGGLVIHVGCGDGTLTAALRANDSYIVQGLDTDVDKIEKARKTIISKGLYGKVTVREFDGKNLPFIDNLVNLIVVTGECKVPEDEILRVLAPRGIAYINGSKTVKPWPMELDEWTHFHHNPQGTMVGKDQVVGPPRRIQWIGAPKWLRNHDFMSSMHAMVSSRGRVFYVIDEGLRNHIFLPSRWTLIARDGFNGTILWKKPLADWHPNNWPLKSGPGHHPRKLVAVGDRVYIAAGLADHVKAINAATGKTIRTYYRTKPTQEIIVSDGVLYLLVDPEQPAVNYRAKTASYKEINHANSGWAWTMANPKRIITVIEADSGKVLWKHTDRVAPLTLTVCDDKVLYHNGQGLVALDHKTGKELWTSEGPAVNRVVTGSSLRVSFSEGIAVFASGTKLTAFSAKDGKQLWTGTLQRTSHHCPEDLFIIDGLIWSPNTGRPQHNGTHFKVLDLRTGEIKRDFVAKNLPGFPMHPRCYPSRATTKYIMTNGMGTEFYKVGGEEVDIHNYIRGSCIYGVMPCNGLLYKPPDSCACYYQSKLEYLCALAPGEFKAESSKSKNRLERGPAYGYRPLTNNDQTSSWLTYRCDAARSGFCPSPVSSDLKKSWQVRLDGKLTQPVVAGGKVFVVAIERQTLYALDTASGKTAWKYTAGGRIDSSPSIYKDLVLFGCGDGRVYCLRAEDGALVWRYLVAPEDRQNVFYQQPESVWPVHGSVLIENNTVYALAGRNMFLDGGMRLVLLDPVTGKKISETVLDENDPRTKKNLQTLINAKYMPIANDDILSSDGERVYMQEQNFDMMGRRINFEPTLPAGKKRSQSESKGKRHLFCQTGFLDDIWFHRSYLIYGQDCGEGWGAYAGPRNSNPTGRIMVLDKSRCFAFRASPLGNMLHPRTTYHLYAVDKEPSKSLPQDKQRKKKGREDGPRISGHTVHWYRKSIPLLINAMALGGKNLFVAGPPDMADETKMLGYLPGANDDINRQLKAQEQAWRGKHGGLLWVVSAENGEILAEYKIDNIPVYDGMSVAQGRVFISLIDGRMLCFEEQ